MKLPSYEAVHATPDYLSTSMRYESPFKGNIKRHRMREPGSDGNLNVMFFQKNSDNMLNDPPVRSIVHHFPWNLLENMTNRFPHIPDFAWISHALPLKICINNFSYCLNFWM